MTENIAKQWLRDHKFPCVIDEENQYAGNKSQQKHLQTVTRGTSNLRISFSTFHSNNESQLVTFLHAIVQTVCSVNTRKVFYRDLMFDLVVLTLIYRVLKKRLTHGSRA